MKTCACCGERCPGEQWYNRDTGFGLCAKCALWLLDRMPVTELVECYGHPGVNFSMT